MVRIDPLHLVAPHAKALPQGTQRKHRGNRGTQGTQRNTEETAVISYMFPCVLCGEGLDFSADGFYFSARPFAGAARRNGARATGGTRHSRSSRAQRYAQSAAA